MRKSLTLWLCVLFLGATVAAVPQAGDAADRTGTWTGTWEGGGGSADGAEVVLAATFEGNACKGTWVLREKANGNPALDGTWSVAKK